MRRTFANRFGYLTLSVALVAAGVIAPQSAQAADSPVASFTFNNVSASSALNATPDSSTDVDDVTIGAGKVLYLPASADPAALSGWLKLADGTNQPFTSTDYTVTPAGDHQYDLTFTGVNASPVRAYQSGQVPAMYIKTKNPGGLDWIEQSKDNKDKGGSVAMIGPDASAAPSYNGALGEIKGRGNSTWNYEKKPYQIKLGTSTELVPSAGAHKTWILLANYLDASLIRNELTYNLEGSMLRRQGLNDYSIKGRMIDLWIDGGYRGSYYLSEKVQVDPTRLPLTDLDKANAAANPGVDLAAMTPTKASTSDTRFAGLKEAQYVYFPNTPSGYQNGGYLLEMDFVSRAREETSYFITKRGTAFTVKSPEIANADELGHIARYVQKLEDAIYADGTAYTNYLDRASFANYYALEELIANDDGFKSSTYFYLDKGGKLNAGPVWDSDRTLGALKTAPDPASIHVGKLSRVKPQWIKQLLAHTDFRQAVQQAYTNNIAPEVNDLLDNGGLAAYASEAADSARLNKLRWPSYNSMTVWSSTPAGDISRLRTYLSQRQTGMKSLFGSGFTKNARLADGTYTIVNGRLNLDVSGGSKVAKANVRLWTPNTSPAQKFTVKRGDDSFYTITNVNSGQVLDVAGGVAANGTNVQQYPSNGTAAQKWAIGTYDGTAFTIASSLAASENGFVLEANGSGTTAGTNIQIASDTGAAGQKFTFGTPLFTGRKYVVTTKLDTGKALDVAGGSTASRANIRIWTANGTKSQQFTLRNISGDVYEIRTGTTTGRAVDVAGGGKKPGTNVWQYQTNGTAAQQWSIRPTGDGDGSYYFVSKLSGLYLDVAGGKSAAGTNVQTWTGNKTAAQKFYLR